MLTPEPVIRGIGMDVEVGCSAAKAWPTLPDWLWLFKVSRESHLRFLYQV